MTSVAEATAMSICFIARRLNSPARMHPAPCRYCPVSLPELIERVKEYNQTCAAQEAEHRRLSGAERARRLKEAQAAPEPEWFEELGA